MLPTREELLRRLAQVEERVEQERREKEREKLEKEQERRDRQALQQLMAPSYFLDYLRSADENLFATFRLPPPSTAMNKSSSKTTHVHGKFYPRRLRPWTGFEDDHVAQFRRMADALEGRALFPALTDVLGVSRDLSPTPIDEMDLRPFIRASIEKPANNSNGLDLADVAAEELQEPERPAAKRQRSPVKRIGIPDRWCVGFQHDGSRTHVLVGEYKAAHKLPAKKLNAVLSTTPGEDFFVQAVKSKDIEPSSATASDAGPNAGPDAESEAAGSERKAVPGDVFIARVLCQAYNYMITSGLEFGYVASGDGLVFLRVLEHDPQTLHYFWSVFPIPPPPDDAAQGAGQATGSRREPHQTAAAYLASLCMLAVQSTPRPMSWIDARDYDLARWPNPYGEIVPLLEMSLPPPLDTDAGGGGASGSGSGTGSGTGSGIGGADNTNPNTTSLPKRPRSDSHDTHNTSQHGYTARTNFVVEPPTLPYCTQACLRGLCNGTPLDDRCPNAALHRAAWLSSPSRRRRRNEYDGHPLTTTALRARVVAQLADNMDKDCECLNRWGCFGRYGVLFKIVVTGYGYTLVAKGVQAVHRHVLQNEAAVYKALTARPGPQHQGRLVPVFLGIVDLRRSLPLHSCARVPHLLSYAGPTLTSSTTREALQAAGTDWETEQDRTVAELAAAGLHNEDVRLANLAWNAEAGRVMQLDFDQAYVRSLPAQRSAQTQEPSPLFTKRDPIVHNGSGDEQPASKRTRIGVTTATGPVHN